MKYILSLILLAGIASAQLFTNTVTVVYTQAQRDAIVAANDLDNNLRTNGFAPYTSPTNSLTLLQYFASKAGIGLQAQSEIDLPVREAQLIQAMRNATPAKRMAAMKAAWLALQ